MRKKPAEHATNFAFHPRTMASLLAYKQPRRYSDLQCEGLSADVKNGKIHFMIRWYDRDNKPASLRIGQFFVPVPDYRNPTASRHMSVDAARKRAGELLRDWHERSLDPRVALHRKKTTALRFSDDMETYIEIKRKSGKWTTTGHNSPENKLRKKLDRHGKTLLVMPTQDITPQHVADAIHAARENPRFPRYTMRHTQGYLLWYIHAIIQMAMKGANKWRFRSDHQNPADPDVQKAYLSLPAYIRKPLAAMPVEADNQQPGVPAFYARLSLLRHRTTNKKGTRSGMVNVERMVGDLMLRFMLLTCAPRTIEVRRATWGQMHLDGPNPEWIIPGENMLKRRNGKEQRGPFRIPLSYLAVAVLRAIRPENPKDTDYVFTYRGMDTRKGKPVAGAMVCAPILWYLLRLRLGVALNEATVHGFRSTMQDFALIHHQHLVIAAQIALDHLPFDNVNETYRRTKLPEDRRILADLWGEFLESELPPEMRTPRPAEAEERHRRYERRRNWDETPQAQWPELQDNINRLIAQNAQLLQATPAPAAASEVVTEHVSTLRPPPKPPEPEPDPAEIVEWWKPGWQADVGMPVRPKRGRNYMRLADRK